MLLLKIDNPEIESMFLQKFDANQDEFIDFIRQSLEALNKSKQQEFSFNKQNPKENSYHMEYKENETDANNSNPFSEVDDTLSLAKSLREKAYR